MIARELLKLLYKDGWYRIGQTGSHLHLKHPVKKGKVTIPIHAGKDLKKGTLNAILKSAGLKYKHYDK